MTCPNCGYYCLNNTVFCMPPLDYEWIKKPMTLEELVIYLNDVDDLAYAGWIENEGTNFLLALKYKKILDRLWGIRCRIGEDILADLL